MSFQLRTTDKDGMSIYRKYHLYAIMLESLADGQYCLPQYLINSITSVIEKEIKLSATVDDVNNAVTYLIHIGMLQVREDNEIRITTSGRDALADCRFQQLASDTFFNYRGMKNNELTLIFAVFSLVVSLVALILTVYV